MVDALFMYFLGKLLKWKVMVCRLYTHIHIYTVGSRVDGRTEVQVRLRKTNLSRFVKIFYLEEHMPLDLKTAVMESNFGVWSD